MHTISEAVPTVIVGLDMSTATSLRMAVLDPTSVHFPWTDDFRCCHSPRALMRHWERRFPPLCQERLVLAVNSTRHAETVLWLQHQGVEVMAAAVHDLRPFLDESRNHDIPTQFHLAHALAGYAAYKTHPRLHLEQAWDTLADVNRYLRNVEATLERLATAFRATSLTYATDNADPPVDLLPF